MLRALDTFCKAGGATKGLQRAGFWVCGVDIEDQPHYCGDMFVQGDAIEFIRKYGREFDFIWASPPCQAYSIAGIEKRLWELTGLIDKCATPITSIAMQNERHPHIIPLLGRFCMVKWHHLAPARRYALHSNQGVVRKCIRDRRPDAVSTVELRPASHPAGRQLKSGSQLCNPSKNLPFLIYPKYAPLPA